jgi:hypothetical protein
MQAANLLILVACGAYISNLGPTAQRLTDAQQKARDRRSPMGVSQIGDMDLATSAADQPGLRQRALPPDLPPKLKERHVNQDETASPFHQKSADLREVDGNQITRITARNALQNRCTTTVLTRQKTIFLHILSGVRILSRALLLYAFNFRSTAHVLCQQPKPTTLGHRSLCASWPCVSRPSVAAPMVVRMAGTSPAMTVRAH